jgi:thioredoxin 2
MSADERKAIVVCPNCGRKNRVPAAASGRPRCGNCHQPLPWTTAADDDSYHAVVEESELPVLVDLWAPWCGPCRTISPALEGIARARAGEVKLVKVNVDESPQVAGRHGVQSIPTLLVLDHGDVVARQIGAAPEATLRAWLDEALTKASSPGSTAGSTPAG